MRSVILAATALSAMFVCSQVAAQVAPPTVVSPVQTGTVTGGTSQATTPKLDADKTAKPEEKTAKPEEKKPVAPAK